MGRGTKRTTRSSGGKKGDSAPAAAVTSPGDGMLVSSDGSGLVTHKDVHNFLNPPKKQKSAAAWLHLETPSQESEIRI